ncbi:unnamed protein product [Schistocephalus solidus]|uniref:DUF3480 domain-containing protein n=1 Tax=Schistocephalus solidus TaxID=70667 RepID=A0A183T801_SCHSO|nr:unnamed protein product [Schistocephalus solidus]
MSCLTDEDLCCTVSYPFLGAIGMTQPFRLVHARSLHMVQLASDAMLFNAIDGAFTLSVGALHSITKSHPSRFFDVPSLVDYRKPTSHSLSGWQIDEQHLQLGLYPLHLGWIGCCTL